MPERSQRLLEQESPFDYRTRQTSRETRTPECRRSPRSGDFQSNPIGSSLACFGKSLTPDGLASWRTSGPSHGQRVSPGRRSCPGGTRMLVCPEVVFDETKPRALVANRLISKSANAFLQAGGRVLSLRRIRDSSRRCGVRRGRLPDGQVAEAAAAVEVVPELGRDDAGQAQVEDEPARA